MHQIMLSDRTSADSFFCRSYFSLRCNWSRNPRGYLGYSFIKIILIPHIIILGTWNKKINSTILTNFKCLYNKMLECISPTDFFGRIIASWQICRRSFSPVEYAYSHKFRHIIFGSHKLLYMSFYLTRKIHRLSKGALGWPINRNFPWILGFDGWLFYYSLNISFWLIE